MKNLKAEIKKQLGDQALHFFVGGAATFLFAMIIGHWSEAFAWIGAVPVAAFWINREIKQWPSTRWYDPPLDWTFQAFGIYAGLWTYY